MTNSMKIALFGYGKMGRLVETIAQKNGHASVCIFDRSFSNKAELENVDVAIDFSASDAVLDHLEACLAANKPLVIGTTGWDHQIGKAKERVSEANGSCFYSPNFSLGIYFFQKLVSYAGLLFQRLDQYDVCGIESHHAQKKDKPSGTAIALSHALKNQMPRVKDFAFTSIRCGHDPGNHTLIFDSQEDKITLSHQAHNREGFAFGALKAAEWLTNKKGFFTMDDMMKDFI